MDVEGPAALLLPQREPPQENAADQQRQQHQGDHADDVEHILRRVHPRGGSYPKGSAAVRFEALVKAYPLSTVSVPPKHGKRTP